MLTRKLDASSSKIGEKMKASGNVLGKKSTKYPTYKPTKDGQNLFNHHGEKKSPLEK